MATDTEQRPSRLKAVAIFFLLAVVPVAALILPASFRGHQPKATSNG